MRRKDMTAEEIALARKWLGVRNEDATPDYIVDAIVNGTFTHARIQLYLACLAVRREFIREIVKLYWRLKILRLSWRWIWQYNIGDEVLYGGKKWTLIQGVCAPAWDLVRSTPNGPIRLFYVDQRRFRKVKSLRNCWGSFVCGYRFYMGNWFAIWVNSGVEPWMLGCSIWPRKEKVFK